MVIALKVVIDEWMIVALSTLKIAAEKNPSEVAGDEMRITTSI